MHQNESLLSLSTVTLQAGVAAVVKHLLAQDSIWRCSTMIVQFDGHAILVKEGHLLRRFELKST